MQRSIIIALLLLIFLTGCGKPDPACPAATGTPTFLTVPPEALPTPTPGPGPQVIEIKNKSILVDKVVEGPLCNDTWSGTVYVGCNVQVYEWTVTPDFLTKCQLNIEPGTVVYVAYHHDTAYYNGCSCHTEEGTDP
jgi:hypothetical protein